MIVYISHIWKATKLTDRWTCVEEFIQRSPDDQVGPGRKERNCQTSKDVGSIILTRLPYSPEEMVGIKFSLAMCRGGSVRHFWNLECIRTKISRCYLTWDR